MARPFAARLLLTLLVPALGAVGCSDDVSPPAASGTPAPPADTGDTPGTSTGTAPATGDSGTATGGTAGAVGIAACDACADDEFCSADHVAGVTDPDALTFTCVGACVEVGDGSRWCGNDASCCEGPCDEFGRCGAPAADSGGTTAGTTAGTTSSGTSSGTSGGSDTLTDSGSSGTGTTGTTGSGSGSGSGSTSTG